MVESKSKKLVSCLPRQCYFTLSERKVTKSRAKNKTKTENNLQDMFHMFLYSLHRTFFLGRWQTEEASVAD